MTWPPKDWRALLALIFSVFGAFVLTLFVWWVIYKLMPDQGWNVSTEADRAKTIRWVAWIAVGAIALVLLGLGMAINRRSFKGNLGGNNLEFSGGDEPEVTGAKRVEQAAQEERRTIEEEVGGGGSNGT